MALMMMSPVTCQSEMYRFHPQGNLRSTRSSNVKYTMMASTIGSSSPKVESKKPFTPPREVHEETGTDLLQKVPHHGINLWLQVQIFYDHVNPVIRRTINQSAGGKLRDLNAEESWALLEDLALYDNESWNDPRDFAKSVKEIALPQDVPTPKRVHFVNSIVILSTDSDTEEEDVSSTNACDLNLGGMVKGKKEVKEQGKEENEMETDMEVDEVIEEEESEFETDEEVEEILEEEEDDEDGENLNLFPTMEELTHHEWLLKNP
ncbi:hypothetical protein Tco_0695847 [Tanacetum coccineum]